MADLVDSADWKGILLKSMNVGASTKQKAHLRYNGKQYATDGEYILAKLLTATGIDFTPNVQFVLKPPADGKRRQDVIYVADFIFDKKAFVWTNADGSEELVHGIECKGMMPGKFPAKAREKVRLLSEQRGIGVKLLSTKEIEEFVARGGLPMRPLR